MKTEHTWNLKTQAAEAAMQTALDSMEAHRKILHESLLEATKQDDVPKAVNEVFNAAEASLTTKLREVTIRCEYAKEYVDRTDKTNKSRDLGMETAIYLAGTAGSMISLACHYLKLLASKSADDEESTMICSVLSNEDIMKVSMVEMKDEIEAEFRALTTKGKPN